MPRTEDFIDSFYSSLCSWKLCATPTLSVLMKGPYFFWEEEEIRRKEGKKGRKRRVGMGKKEGERFVKKGRGRRMDGWVDG